MIFRLSQKLSAKIKVGTLATLPLDENPFADWSAGLFRVGRVQYILISNTRSLYSTVLPGSGSKDISSFIERSLNSVREFLEADGQEGVYKRFIVPISETVRFAKALNRSVIGSMIDMTKHAVYLLAAGGSSPFGHFDGLDLELVNPHVTRTSGRRTIFQVALDAHVLRESASQGDSRQNRHA